MPTDRVHQLLQQAQLRAFPPDSPQPAASDAATQLRHARPAPNERRYTRYVALHPLRSATPEQKRSNAYGSGAPPPTTSPTAGNSSPQTPTGSSSVPHSGVTPLSNQCRCGDMPRLSSRNARQRSSAATEEPTHDRKTGAGNEAANSRTHQ